MFNQSRTSFRLNQSFGKCDQTFPIGHTHPCIVSHSTTTRLDGVAWQPFKSHFPTGSLFSTVCSQLFYPICHLPTLTHLTGNIWNTLIITQGKQARGEAIHQNAVACFVSCFHECSALVALPASPNSNCSHLWFTCAHDDRPVLVFPGY